MPAVLAKAIPGRMTKFKLNELSGVNEPAQKPARAVIMKRDDTDEQPVMCEFIKREFSPKDRKQLAGEGKALPDGSFPIVTEADLHNAISAFGRAADKAKAKAHIIARANAMGMSSALPDGWVSKADPGPGEESVMDKELLKSLGLPETATADQVIKALQEQNAKITKAAADAGAVAEKAARKAAATAQELAYIKAKAMSDDDADDFLAKPKDEKAKKMADLEKSDESFVSGGVTILKSAVGEGVFLVLKAQAEQLTQTQAAFAKAEEARLFAGFEKRAIEEFPHISGTVQERATMLKGIEAMADPVAKKASLDALTAAEAMSKLAFNKFGLGGDQSFNKSEDNPEAKLTKMAEDLKKADPKLSFAKAYEQAAESPEGRRLYETIKADRRAVRPDAA